MASRKYTDKVKGVIATIGSGITARVNTVPNSSTIKGEKEKRCIYSQ